MDDFDEYGEDATPDYEVWEQNQVFLDNEGSDESEDDDDAAAEEEQRIDAERDEPRHDEWPEPEHDDTD